MPTVAPADVPIRSWLQAPFRAPSACTIRIAISGGGGNHDWTVTAGTTWVSLDALVTSWNTALAGAAAVSLVTDATLHRSKPKVTTGTGATFTVTWSQSGDGTAIRNRLGAVGDLGSTASGAVWSNPVIGAFYSWVGFSRIVRGRTGISNGSAAKMMNGTVVSQHSRDGGSEPIDMEVTLRWGLPPGGIGISRFSGHLAFETFLRDLYSTTNNTPSDTFALYHLAGGTTAEGWLVRLDDDRSRLRPTCVLQPHGLFEMGLKLNVVESPL